MSCRLLPLLAVFAVAGCAAQIASDEETMLAAAGFEAAPLSTPAPYAAVNAQPAPGPVPTERNGRIVWQYVDPQFCRCVYTGDQAAYQRYARLRYQSRIVEAQRQTAELNRFGWPGYGPWGPWGPWGW